MKAVWKGAVLAESDATIVVEGNHYFPPESIHREYFKPSSTHTTCPWKGLASYYTIDVSGEVNAMRPGIIPNPKTRPKTSKIM